MLSAYGPSYGLTPEQALGLGSGFSGGMAMAETCGAVTSAFMVLGLDRCSNLAAAQADGRAEAKAAVLEFSKAFKARNGSLLCRELLNCDISDPKGLALAREKGLFRTICPKFVKDAAEILNELLLHERQAS